MRVSCLVSGDSQLPTNTRRVYMISTWAKFSHMFPGSQHHFAWFSTPCCASSPSCCLDMSPPIYVLCRIGRHKSAMSCQTGIGSSYKFAARHPPFVYLTPKPFPPYCRQYCHNMTRTNERPRGTAQDSIFSSNSVAMGSGSVFSDTLRDITNTKLDEVSKRRAEFNKNRSSLLKSTGHLAKDDPVAKLESLSAGVRQCLGIKSDKAGKVIKTDAHPHLSAQLSNLDRFLAQARHDPTVSANLLVDWEQSLRRHLDIQSLKFEYATLYGKLVTEWLAADQRPNTKDGQGKESRDAGSVDAEASAKSKWEAKVFEPAQVDVSRLRTYLDALFNPSDEGHELQASRQAQRALQHLRTQVEAFEVEMSRPHQFDLGSIKRVITSLLGSDTLSNEEREALKDFSGNDIILAEICDVLGMRMSALSSWTWGPGVPVEQRRRINGTYKIHMHEDLLQALFVQYIGIQWSMFFRKALSNFRMSAPWLPLAGDIPEAEKRRLEHYVSTRRQGRCLQLARQDLYHRDYFAAKLIRDVDSIPVVVDGEYDADFGPVVKKKKQAAPMKQMAPKPTVGGLFGSSSGHVRALGPAEAYGQNQLFMQGGSEQSATCHHEVVEAPKTSMAAKQQLLHVLSTEIAINTKLHGGLTSFHAIFEEWETTLPHETILTILEYFGVSENSGWLVFFKRFLQAPLKVVQGGEASTNARTRLRGVPPSRLSDVFSEAVLFCLDFDINQATSGQPLWRCEDDLWFWNKNHETAVTAWKTVMAFTSITGTSIDGGKSGSARISREETGGLEGNKGLPDGDIRWGFLVLNSLTGRFEIDQEMVDSHVDDLRNQLEQKKHSVFALIQTWNTYTAKFLPSNFGKTAHCFSRQHVDDVLCTHRRIQKKIFTGTGTSVERDGFSAASSILDYLRKTVEHRFGVKNIPDGYFWFPTELGGLDLQSPIVSLLQVRDSMPTSHDDLFDEMFEAERVTYHRLKTQFDGRRRGGGASLFGKSTTSLLPENERDQENFISYAELFRYREDLDIPLDDKSKDIYEVFQKLLREPEQQSVEDDVSSGVLTALENRNAMVPSAPMTWTNLSPYLQWILTMYGPEVLDRFGGLSFVDHGLLPLGMVRLVKERRATW